MYLPSEQFTPVLPAMHAQRPSNRLHVSLTPQVQFSWQFLPKRVELHSKIKYINNLKFERDKAIMRERDRRTDRQTDREIGIRTNRLTDRQPETHVSLLLH